jgi:hypothetical protein
MSSARGKRVVHVPGRKERCLILQEILLDRGRRSSSTSEIWEWEIIRLSWRYLFSMIGWWSAPVLVIGFAGTAYAWGLAKELIGLGDD